MTDKQGWRIVTRILLILITCVILLDIGKVMRAHASVPQPITHSTFDHKQRYAHTGTSPANAQYYNIYTENDYRFHYTRLLLTRQGNVFLPRFTVQAIRIAGWNYPNIGQGANHGMFPSHGGHRKTWYPVKANHDGDPYATLSDHLIWRGNWQAGFDVWFEPHYDPTGQLQQHGGTELMILTAVCRQGHPVNEGLPGFTQRSVYIDGRWWNVAASTAHAYGKSWHRIYIVAQHAMSSFSGPLNGFFRAAEHYGALDGNAWLTGLEYGFEINAGGIGLAVNSYDLHGVVNATSRHATYDLGVTVPRVTGLRQQVAVQELKHLGFKVWQLTRYVRHRTLIVSAQSLKPGMRYLHGSVIKIRSQVRR